MRATPAIRLNECADGVAVAGLSAPGIRRDHARRGASPALELITNHAGPAADAAFGDRPALRGIERVRDVLRFHMESVDVIQPAVPGFGDHRQAPPVTGLIRRAVREAPRDDRVARHAHAMGVGNNDRPLEKAALFHPRGAGHLSVAVQTESPGINRIVQRIVAAWNDRGHAGADRTFADLEFSLAADQSREADFDSGDVRDRVEFSGRAVKWNAERAGANGGRFRRGRLRLAGLERRSEKKR